MEHWSNKVCVLIPAKGESNGLKKKNISLLGDTSLVEIALLHAHEFSSSVCVSSESDEVFSHVKNLLVSGRPPMFIFRQKYLATPEASTYSVVLDALPHILNEQSAEYVIVLQCTHPFRRVTALVSQMKKFFESGKECGFSGSPAMNHVFFEAGDKLHPTNRTWDHRPRRQEMSKHIQDDGSFFISRIDKLAGHNDLIWEDPFVFNGNYCGPDIHTQEDLDIARALWKPEFIYGVP